MPNPCVGNQFQQVCLFGYANAAFHSVLELLSSNLLSKLFLSKFYIFHFIFFLHAYFRDHLLIQCMKYNASFSYNSVQRPLFSSVFLN